MDALLYVRHFFYPHHLCFQGEVSDIPRFSLFHISFGLELVALVLSAIADITPEARERAKRVFLIRSLICFHHYSSLPV